LCFQADEDQGGRPHIPLQKRFFIVAHLDLSHFSSISNRGFCFAGTIDEEDLKEGEDDFGDAFPQFCREARALLPMDKKADVYIGFWGSQATFVPPQEFFDLIHATKWPVVIDIND